MTTQSEVASDERLTLPGPEAAAVLELEAEYLSPGVAPDRPLVWRSADGSTITDVDGNTYDDLASGVLITNLGHAHPRVTAAVVEAAGGSLTFHNAAHPRRAELSRRLAELLPADLNRSLFFSGGAEAVDAAIRLARLHTGRQGIVSFRGAFHGRSYLALSVSGITRLRSGFGLGVPGVVHADYPSRDSGPEDWLARLENLLETAAPSDVAAVLAEPYQGAGGVIIPPTEFLPRLREVCDRIGALLIVDEIQAGFGRTGEMFAFEHSGVVPDMVTLGKPLANGFPMAAVVAREEIAAVVPRESLSSTFGGNPVACAAALAVLDVFAEEDAVGAGRTLAESLREPLARIAERPAVRATRQWGMAIGIEVLPEWTDPRAFARAVVEECLHRGVVMISPIGLRGNVLRIGPALNMDPAQARGALATVEVVISELERRAT